LPPFTSVSQGVWSDRYGQDTQFWRSPEPYTRTPAEQASNNGTDTLTNIERVNFADGGIAYDLSGNQDGAIVAGLMRAVFGGSDLTNKAHAGIGLKIIGAGFTATQLAAAALDAKLGATASNTEIVKLLYANVTGTAPTDAQAAPFNLLLDSGQLTKGELVLAAAMHDVNQQSVEMVGVKAAGLAFDVV